jgi:hypothetical protein
MLNYDEVQQIKEFWETRFYFACFIIVLLSALVIKLIL